MNIRQCNNDDLRDICAIYNHYIETTVVTFEERPVAVDEIGRRVALCTAHYPWLVSTENGRVTGYAYARRWQERAAYRHSVETTVYVAAGEERKGYGSALYRALLDELARRDCHTVIAGIALPNAASVGLHEAAGFTKVAHFFEVGKKFDRWVDVGYWQLTLR